MESKNIGRMMAQLGVIPPDSPMNLDDKDLIEELGLDPNLEGTPEINDAALAATMRRQRREYESAGLDSKDIDRLIKEQTASTKASHAKIQKAWDKRVGKP